MPLPSSALEEATRQALRLPVRDQDAAAEVAAGGEPANIERVGVAAEACGVLVDPGHRPPALIDHGHQVAVELGHVVEIDRDEMRTGLDERLRQIGGLARAAAAPGAAMQEDQDRRVRA